MRIAVTGSRGFLGRHAGPWLTARGVDVVPIEADLRDPRAVSAAIGDVDGVFHFAARMGGVGYHSIEQFHPPLDNMLIDMNVLSVCSERRIRLLYASSACALPVYAMNEGRPLTEGMLDWPADPDQMYGWQKLFVTRLAAHADFDCRVALLHTIYGDGQEYRTRRAKFLPAICYKFATADEVEVWGDGTQTRTFLHVDDALPMLFAVFTGEYAGPVNVSGLEEVSVREVVELLAAHTGQRAIRFVPDAPVGPRRRAVDMSVFLERYGVRPAISLETGLIRLYESIKSRVLADAD